MAKSTKDAKPQTPKDDTGKGKDFYIESSANLGKRNMLHIQALEIRYFRSVHRLTVRDIKDLTVLSGRNDVGKSNLLKALNLFFNNETDWNTPFDFSRDFSKVRLNEVRRDTIRGKQFIQIRILFARGPRYTKSLPERFWVTRTWTRDKPTPDTRSDLPSLFKLRKVPAKKLSRAEASLQRFLNTFRFQYVPAIKDQAFFGHMLSRLQDIIFERSAEDNAIVGAVKGLNESVTTAVAQLKEEFQKSTDIPVDINLPKEIGELFRAFAVSTTDAGENMPIQVRGDGIRCRFIPSLLNYISSASNLYHIWGFEEPENSIEHALNTKLARRMCEEYSNHSQIILTSHSPAFFTLKGDNVAVFRVTRDPILNTTTLFTDEEIPSPSRLTNALEEELGLLEFQKEFQAKYDEKVFRLENEREAVKKLEVEIKAQASPILLTEGKWDVHILKHAWDKLYPNTTIPFRLLSCTTTDENSGEGSGGAATLQATLETVRPDQPITVGLFDRDCEGHKQYTKLNANFQNDGDKDIRLQKTGTAAAILLPTPPGREKYAEVQNLPMEFLFEDVHLNKSVEGKRLILKPRTLRQRVDNLLFQEIAKTTQPHLREIDRGSKKGFAEKVVPSLPPEAFENFRPLLELISQTIAKLGENRGRKKVTLPPRPKSSGHGQVAFI